MTKKTLSELRRDVESLKDEYGYGDDTPGELYMKSLQDAHDGYPNYPGAGEEWMRRYKRQNRARDAE